MTTPRNTVRADRHGRQRWRVLGWVSVATAVMLVAGSLTTYGFYRKLSGNIRQHDVLGKLGDDRPGRARGVENILLIGSDTRVGQGENYGTTVEGARSDTLILLHLSTERDKAVLVSFPRDSVVDIPSCQAPDGSVVPPHTAMINEALNLGGPACSWRTIESLTGIRVDHFVQIDFSGFKHVVNALGGVEICLPEAVDDPKARLNLPAGRHVVNGEQALGYVRTRYGIGDGSDLERIQRQQKFMAAVIEKATSTRLLFDPPRLYRFLDAITHSVSTDRGLALIDLRRIAESVKGMGTDEVTFVTVPTQPAPSNPNRLVWTQPAAGRLFEAIRANARVPSSVPSPGVPGSAAPSQVQIRVLNGTEIDGLAGRTADELRAHGFRVVGVGNTEAPAAETIVRYGPEAQPQAAAVAEAVQGARTVEREMTSDTVELVIGNDWQGLDPAGPGSHGGQASQGATLREPGAQAPNAQAPGAPSPVDSGTAADNVCA